MRMCVCVSMSVIEWESVCALFLLRIFCFDLAFECVHLEIHFFTFFVVAVAVAVIFVFAFVHFLPLYCFYCYCICAHSLLLCCARTFSCFFLCSCHLTYSFRIHSLYFSFVLQLRAYAEEVRQSHTICYDSNTNLSFFNICMYMCIMIASNRCGHRLVVAAAVVCVFFV